MEGKENIRVEVRDHGARQEEEKAAFVTKIKTEHVNLYYGERQVLKDITFDMGENKVTAFIGPSGCGKSSYLRCLNRMNDFISSARVEGTINIDGENILAPSTDVIGLRRKVGMVFQKPNPFPMSIYDNIAYGPRLNGITRSRTSSRPPARASRADSSSASASRARRRRSRTSCSWTSRPPRSTRCPR